MGSINGRPQNRLKWGRGSERPAAHTQQKLTQVPPRPPPPPDPSRLQGIQPQRFITH